MNFAAALENEDSAEEKVVEAEFLPAIKDELSLEAVRPQFAEYLVSVEKMKRDAENVEITDEKSVQFAVALVGEAKRIAKKLEAKEDAVTEKAKGFTKSVHSFVQMFTEVLVLNAKKGNPGCVEAILKKKIGDYQYKIQIEHQKQQKAADEAAKALQNKIDGDAKQAGVEAPKVVAPVIPESKPITRTETGTTSYQVERWVCTVEDAKVVPREYCEPSKKLLDEAVKMGAREIPGCKIEKVTDTRFRT